MTQSNRADPPRLTRRESQLVQLYGQGMVDKQISQRLGLATSTVRSHLASLCGKVGAAQRLQCGILLERLGLTRDIVIRPRR